MTELFSTSDSFKSTIGLASTQSLWTDAYSQVHPPEKAEPKLGQQAQDDFYTVKKGDNLWNIASKIAGARLGRKADGQEVNAAIQDIVRASGLASTVIHPDQILTISANLFAKKLPVVVIEDAQSNAPSQSPTDKAKEVPDRSSEVRTQMKTEDQLASQTKPDHKTTSTSPDEDFTKQLSEVVSKNESTSYRSINWDDNSAGISIGVMQWNQRKGQLPVLFEEWHKQYPFAFNAIFHDRASNGKTYAQNLLDENFVRSADFRYDPTLRKALVKALAHPGFQRVQDELSQDMVENYRDIAHKHGVHSQYGVGLVVDASNQLGPYAVAKMLKRIIASSQSETETVKKFARAIAFRPQAKQRAQTVWMHLADYAP